MASQLENALNHIAPVDGRLSICHVTLKKYITDIVNTKELCPVFCNTLNESVLFLSYGSAYYRPDNHQTEDTLELPIAFVFDKKLFNEIDRYYPFDTGALGQGYFGHMWQNELSPIDDFSTSQIDAPEKMVSCLYGTNSRYLAGDPLQETNINGDPISTLSRFLNTDLSNDDIDERQRTIECIMLKSIQLVDRLQYIMYPDSLSPQIKQIWNECQSKFGFQSYPTSRSFNPASIITHINMELRKVLSFEIEGP